MPCTADGTDVGSGFKLQGSYNYRMYTGVYIGSRRICARLGVEG